VNGRVRVRGGARVLSDQSACPFRAFARHRLAAEHLEDPAPGLDAAARGTLLHRLMKGIWDELKTKSALDAMPAAELAAIVGRAAAAAVSAAQRDHAIEDRFAELERARLARLALEWLAIERERADFEVAATEDKRTLGAGRLEFSGRIDRMDRLTGGGYALIDYKSGRVTPKYWEGERPEEPQLPLYAVNAGETVSAVAFARLKTGGMRLMGHSRDAGVMPKVKQYRDWDALLAGWKKELDALGNAFAAGDARVDPKRLAQTCRYCELAPLCRVHEKLSALELDSGDAAGEGAEDEEGE
jgi:probable DNA repair protein